MPMCGMPDLFPYYTKNNAFRHKWRIGQGLRGESAAPNITRHGPFLRQHSRTASTVGSTYIGVAW